MLCSVQALEKQRKTIGKSPLVQCCLKFSPISLLLFTFQSPQRATKSIFGMFHSFGGRVRVKYAYSILPGTRAQNLLAF